MLYSVIFQSIFHLEKFEGADIIITNDTPSNQH